MSQELIDQRAVPKRIGQADQAGGDLQVEPVCRRFPAPAPAHANLLAPGVNDHRAGRIDQHAPKRFERPGAQRVDQTQRRRRRNLDQAQARLIGVFADEFGVEADHAGFADASAAFRDGGGIGNDKFLKRIHWHDHKDVLAGCDGLSSSYAGEPMPTRTDAVRQHLSPCGRASKGAVVKNLRAGLRDQGGEHVAIQADC